MASLNVGRRSSARQQRVKAQSSHQLHAQGPLETASPQENGCLESFGTAGCAHLCVVPAATIRLLHHRAMPITRDELYEQIWSEPAGKVAARYGVSGSYLARICARLRVPRPERGYWARLEAGKRVVKTKLPDARPGDEQVWAPDVPHWQQRALREPELRPPESISAEPVAVTKARRRHRLLEGVDAMFRRGEHRRDGYLRPSTRQLPDISVSEKRLDDAMVVANALFTTLESRGHDVVFAPGDQAVYRDVPAFPGDDSNYYDRTRWAPARATVTYVGTVAIGLAIIEPATQMEVETVDDKLVPVDRLPVQAKQRLESWRSRLAGYGVHKAWMPSGELQIYAYCPYRDAKWAQSWSAPSRSKLCEQVPDVVVTLESIVGALISDIAAGRTRREAEERKQAIEWEQYKAKLAKEERERALDELRKGVLQLAREWVEAEEMKRFLAEAEASCAALADEQRDEVLRRVRFARQALWLPTAARQLMRLRLPNLEEPGG